MALSQLITTIDITNSNIGIGNVVGANTTNAIALGNQQNVGIGINTPLTGLHVMGTGSVIPGLYLGDATGKILPTIGANDGIFSVVAGVPTFTNALGSHTIITTDANTVGTSTLVDGTVVVNETGVKPTSVILLTRTSTTGDVTTIGTLNVVADTDEFTVNSTVVTDVGSFNYMIVG